MTYQDGYELNLNNDNEEIEPQVEWYSSDILLGGFYETFHKKFVD